MHLRRAIAVVVVAATVVCGAVTLGPTPAAASAPVACAPTIENESQTQSPTPGNPCWTDVTPYPFGFDGNPVVPDQTPCAPQNGFGPNWQGDLVPQSGPDCYLVVTSMAFRSWNRGLAATSEVTKIYNVGNEASNAFGVWLFNGTNWFPDPSFPGAAACPGSQVLWAGKLDYWLVGGQPQSQPAVQGSTALCRFDGINLSWEPLSLPAATLAKLPINPSTGAPAGGITTGACFAWNNCMFFGVDGIAVHWDGQALSDVSAGAGTSPWLQNDFTAAVAGTDQAGTPFALAVTRAGSLQWAAANPVTQPAAPQPDGSPAPQLFGSSGGPFTPLGFTPPTTPAPQGKGTDLVAVAADRSGDVWTAGDPAAAGDVPLLRLSENGAPVSCSGYDAQTFGQQAAADPAYASTAFTGNFGTSLAVDPADGSAFAGLTPPTGQPALIHAACGSAPSVSEFAMPDPFDANQATAPMQPMNNFINVVAANAGNDAWAATSEGQVTLQCTGCGQAGTRPHLFRWTDTQPPNAPAGDDNESRPSLFTLSPPVYQVAPPVVVVITPPPTTTTQTKPPKTVHQKAAVYDVHTKVHRLRSGTFILYVSFRVRRPVRIEVVALRHRKVVASSGFRSFHGRTGVLKLTLHPKRWPTGGLKFVLPKQQR